ncbi:uncharacterized protein K452DRAFT_256978 [Aplosporella prunicola CBS 121167]|uniref:BTB domain-containing protein n=1 Tax=Aplosporella prunicola CBS 121167 TaxID=1176127 RepID=A0A6A6B1L9_9PEZI|nr:uncharacterized protein K452DRAFT_256978 [Aplosporella prunicola CBS 121167]KAF2138112.1 hypothetical protein K452DRAFT_256978 [Aplosporella prunicola CBS 121167]
MPAGSLFATPPASPTSTNAENKEGQPQAPGITIISETGDLTLRVKAEDDQEGFRYRVDSHRLQAASPYFENLLSPRFSEGATVTAQHERLRKQYKNLADAPVEELPQITIVDIGRISKVKTIELITADFLRVLHDQSLGKDSPPIPNIGNLAIVADRFDALPTLSQYVHRRKYFQAIDAKTKLKGASNVPEERTRQKLMIGVMLDYAPWVRMYSKRLTLSGSTRWKAQGFEEPGALWWDIPAGIEEEIMHRRQCVLETISSLQSYFLKLYTSGQRQCRLGYDSSAQCDVFQLGEMVRFFTKVGTLRLESTIFGADPPDDYEGDINRLLESLRQCPAYQIDNNHSHCGLRTKLIPLLDMVQSCISSSAEGSDIGICGDCWRNHRREYAWTESKRPVLWTNSRFFISNSRMPPKGVHGRDGCLARHSGLRDMFTAAERDWTAKDAY